MEIPSRRNEKSNGMPIKSQLNDVRVDTIIDKPVTRQEVVLNHEPEKNEIWVSDASGFKVVAFNLEDKNKEKLSILLSEEEKRTSSGFRELLAVHKTVQCWLNMKLQKRHVYWCTDSSNVVSFLSKGSGKAHIQKIVFEIAKNLNQLETIITPIHLLREDPRIGEADLLSKTKDSDDWSVDQVSFQSMDRVFHFTLDLFASEENAKVKKFFSEYMTPSTSGIDAFAQDWSKDVLWICAPIKYLIRIAIRIRKSEAEGVILVPSWITSSFYNFYFDERREAKKPFTEVKRWKPFIFQNQGAEGPLKGKIEFEFIALYFNTKK